MSQYIETGLYLVRMFAECQTQPALDSIQYHMQSLVDHAVQQKAEIERLQKEVVNRNQRALDGDKAAAVTEHLLDTIEKHEAEIARLTEENKTLKTFVDNTESEWLTGCPQCGMPNGCDCHDEGYDQTRDAINIKTGKEYQVIGEAINATNAQDGQVMVIYWADMYFVREKEEFSSKFKFKDQE